MNRSPLLLLLASASPARRATLSAAGIRHAVMVSKTDEDALLRDAHAQAKASGHTLTAAEQVQLLASAKAHDVAARILTEGNPDGVTAIVGCDSMFEMDGEVVGKPHTPDIARERLRRMSGNAGNLFTGHCVIRLDSSEPTSEISATNISTTTTHITELTNKTGRSTKATGISKATVHIAELSDADIEAYIASGEPLEVAGSFTIDGRGGPFVERIEGDHHGVVGISLPLLRILLAELSLPITDFWE